MAMTIDGGYVDEPTYNIDLELKYNGLYSKFVNKIFFRGEYNYITQWGFSVQRKYLTYKNMSVKYHFELNSSYNENELKNIDIDSLLYDYFHSKNMSPEINVTVNQILQCEREMKMLQLKKQMKRDKNPIYKILNKLKRK